MPKVRTRDALKLIDQMVGPDVDMQELVAQADINAEVGQLIYDARNAAGLTQKQLAELIGTRQPVIARLEDADYEGHSLTMLQRVAKALNRRLEIRLLPARRRALRRAS